MDPDKRVLKAVQEAQSNTAAGEEDAEGRRSWTSSMNSMDTFDLDMPCRVHDGLNDQIIEWSPQWASMYRERASKSDEGVISWDGLLLDGWAPIVPSHPRGH